MFIGRVIGSIWATRKEQSLSGLKLLVVKPLDILTGRGDESPIVAADIIGAGVGETVLIVQGSSARTAVGSASVSVAATVVAIVDDNEINRDLL